MGSSCRYYQPIDGASYDPRNFCATSWAKTAYAWECGSNGKVKCIGTGGPWYYKTLCDKIGFYPQMDWRLETTGTYNCDTLEP